MRRNYEIHTYVICVNVSKSTFYFAEFLNVSVAKTKFSSLFVEGMS